MANRRSTSDVISNCTSKDVYMNDLVMYRKAGIICHGKIKGFYMKVRLSRNTEILSVNIQLYQHEWKLEKREIAWID